MSTSHADTVRTYAAAFATCDLETILGCVSDDLVWEFNGARAGEGKAAFRTQMHSDLATGSAEVTIEELVEQGNVVVALNRGRFIPQQGESMSYVSAEAYTFSRDKISHIRTYQPM